MKEEKKNHRDRVEQLLQASEVAKFRMLQDYLNRIAGGEILKPSEYRTLNKLEVELKRGHDDEYLNYDGAAEFLGCSKRTLHLRIKKGEIKQEADGTFKKSHLQEIKMLYLPKQQDGKEELRQAELRYRHWKALREELIVQQLQGKLVSIEEVERQFALRAYELTRGLMFLSRRVGHSLAGKSKKKLKECIDCVDKEVHELMTRYSRNMAIGEEIADATGSN